MAEVICKLTNITKKFRKQTVVEHVSLCVEKGQIYGLIGKNGAGKTTVLRMIAGQTMATAGELALFGALGERELSRMRRRTGALIEAPSFYPFLSVRRNMEYYRIQRGIPGKASVDQVLEEVGLKEVEKKLFRQLSLGMKQRLGLALALLNHPDFLILDEPINGLDPMGLMEIRQILLRLNREKHVTILMSSHILSELEMLATHYGFLKDGRLLEQISAEELQERCRACLEVCVGDAGKAAVLLESKWNFYDYEVRPHGVLEVYGFLDRPQALTRLFVEQCVELFSITT